MAEFNPFAAEAIDNNDYTVSLNGPNHPHYLPAPGQRVNVWPYYLTEKALGQPTGGGTEYPNNSAVFTLGGFGGHVVLAFDHDVENNPANPFGIDAIVFSNTMWYDSDPNYHGGELGTKEIMPEINGNNIPADDPCEIWYIIPGSHLPDPCSFRVRTWDRNDVNITGHPDFDNSWPQIYQTSAFELFPVYENVSDDPIYDPAWVLANPHRNDGNPDNDHLESHWGYVEYTPTLKLGDRNADDFNDSFGDCPEMPEKIFYTTPDDPYIVGISTGSGGGDGFDISWAVDPCSWQPANLQSFRYIRITTAVDNREFGDEGLLGEISTEIDAVADVRPFGDVNGDNNVDFIDLGLLADSWLSQWPQQNFRPGADFVPDNKIDMLDFSRLASGYKK